MTYFYWFYTDGTPFDVWCSSKAEDVRQFVEQACATWYAGKILRVRYEDWTAEQAFAEGAK